MTRPWPDRKQIRAQKQQHIKLSIKKLVLLRILSSNMMVFQGAHDITGAINFNHAKRLTISIMSGLAMAANMALLLCSFHAPAVTSLTS